MMIFALFYFVFFVGVVIFAGFVFYHLKRYTVNPRLMKPLRALFVVVTAALLLLNAFTFLQIPLDELFRSSLEF